MEISGYFFSKNINYDEIDRILPAKKLFSPLIKIKKYNDSLILEQRLFGPKVNILKAIKLLEQTLDRQEKQTHKFSTIAHYSFNREPKFTQRYSLLPFIDLTFNYDINSIANYYIANSEIIINDKNSILLSENCKNPKDWFTQVYDQIQNYKDNELNSSPGFELLNFLYELDCTPTQQHEKNQLQSFRLNYNISETIDSYASNVFSNSTVFGIDIDYYPFSGKIYINGKQINDKAIEFYKTISKKIPEPIFDYNIFFIKK